MLTSVEVTTSKVGSTAGKVVPSLTSFVFGTPLKGASATEWDGWLTDGLSRLPTNGPRSTWPCLLCSQACCSRPVLMHTYTAVGPSRLILYLQQYAALTRAHTKEPPTWPETIPIAIAGSAVAGGWRRSFPDSTGGDIQTLKIPTQRMRTGSSCTRVSGADTGGT